MNVSLAEDWLRWGLVLMLGFPILMLLVGELILQLDKRHHPMVKVMRELRTFVFPLAALFFLLTRVLELSGDWVVIKIVETLAWVALIAVALSFANVLLFTGAKPHSWQAEIPKLFRDLVRVFLIAIGAALVLREVFDQDLGGLVAALGLGGVVIGFALQDTLGNLISGMALLFERPFQVGDWLEIDGNRGKVVEVNWRSVHIVNRELEMLVVPNSILSQAVIRNYKGPQTRHIEPVDIGFSYDDPPNKVKRVMIETALGTDGVLDTPAPIVHTLSYDDFSITYRVRLFLADYALVPTIRDEFVTRIWYAAKRNGLSIPFPIRDVYHHHAPKVTDGEMLRRLASYMKSLPSLAMVEDAVLEDMAAQASFCHFGAGESPIVQDQQGVKLHFVLAGSAIAFFQDAKGKKHTIAALTRGDFFGYSAVLANEPTPMTVTASEDLEVLILEVEAVQKMLSQTPLFAQQLGAVIDARQSKLQAAQPTVHRNGTLLSSIG
ncbi:mechanosensitive ion channel family protein [cf. Phormidesmis sp. LEGE 11477]|uniref:mechanosensitive ion channel family protein n=1 Tax=cf. Phormidesmis sp. LEGE 11477 TaxID=1828680 RepID=UPI00187FB2D8|nr:mechanosensitive ion channel family protein [cf. Phormidesmis sp. LEGE 11477]MBE9061309.1 mechanosensitive ion channel family protein [cf. Phormidesmis sp. LEGE 11477]